ncbi:MAG TPA: hypothetical protein PLO16_15515 [Acidocella sp.]|nr:hypothetical protein [Acidocella sp.]
MNARAFFLIAAVAGVGILHTIVPDHWVPITLIARQRGWSKRETGEAAFKAGVGHVLSTLVISIAVWIAGVAFADKFGHVVDTAASLALIGFGGWIAVSALREMRGSGGQRHTHGHALGHSHDFSHLGGTPGPDGIHGPELQEIETGHGALKLSIFESGQPPHFRLTGTTADSIDVETLRDNSARQIFTMVKRKDYWESVDEIPEPHGFTVEITVEHGGHAHKYPAEFIEHAHDHHGHDHGEEPENDPLYAPLRGGEVVLVRHAHIHRHGNGPAHQHFHDHDAQNTHNIATNTEAAPPLHVHQHKTSSRTALLLILGSSPMVEGIPAFFAAGKYGVGVIGLMAIVFAISTIATYVLLCVYSTTSLQRVSFGRFERYGEVLSGAFIALVGVVFWLFPVL